jgi:hypothetical protein
MNQQKVCFSWTTNFIVNDIRAEFSFSLRPCKINKLIQTPYYYLLMAKQKTKSDRHWMPRLMTKSV